MGNIEGFDYSYVHVTSDIGVLVRRISLRSHTCAPDVLGVPSPSSSNLAQQCTLGDSGEKE